MRTVIHAALVHGARSLACVAALALVHLCATDALCLEIDFEPYVEGEILAADALGPGLTLTVTSAVPGRTTAGVIFDSSCAGGCSGGDSDLRTPGVGTGNSAAQGNVLVVAEHLLDESPADGLVDDPDDDELGGTITIDFAEPRKVVSLRVLDVETSAAGSRLILEHADASVREVAFGLLGDSSAQTVLVSDPSAVVSMSVVFVESGAIDDIVLLSVCGDGTVDPGEQCDDGNLDDGDCCSRLCEPSPTGLPCDDGDACTSDDRCDAQGRCEGGAGPCGDGVVDEACGEQCDDGNATAGDCCGATCRFEPVGAACAGDSEVCTDDVCDGAGACMHADNQSPCDDGDACTVEDVCGAGICTRGTDVTCDDDNQCTDDACGADAGCTFVNDDTNECDNGDPTDDPDMCRDGVCVGTGGCNGDDSRCDDSNACTDDLCLESGECSHVAGDAPCDDGNPCTSGDVCSAGACVSGGPTDCNDENPCTEDSCDLVGGCQHAAVTGSCDDGLHCNGADVCAGGECTHGGDPCAQGQGGGVCRTGCDETTDQCLDPAGSPCDDGNACTPDDMCDGAGNCVAGGNTCGNGTVEAECGEECDPPDEVSCDEQCKSSTMCGDGVIDPGEDCDDGNDNLEDGCAFCLLDDLTCFNGSGAFPSRAAGRIVFESTRNWDGNNVDNNQEIFLFERRRYRAALRAGAEKVSALADSIIQMSDTQAPIRNSLPTMNGSARFISFVSDGDVLDDGSNVDGNREIFHLDRRRQILRQVTDTADVANLNPSLRVLRGRILVFDSPANLVPDICVGTRNEFTQCATNADCSEGVCGNPEGNREVFRWERPVRSQTPRRKTIRQLTAAPVGNSVIGNSVNFFTRAAAFSSDADLIGGNGDLSREIYRIVKKASKTVQVTGVPNPLQSAESPSQAQKRKIAYSSNSDPVGENPDGNFEIFLWTERKGTPEVKQVTNTQGCINANPAIDARASFVAFQSTCDLVPSAPNPDQSIFVYSVDTSSYLNLIIRGPGDSASSRPIISSSKLIITFESDPGGSAPNLVCIFDGRRGLLESIF